MTKVTIDPQTPSEKLMSNESASLQKEVTDADGKVYGLRVPDALDEFDIINALGKESTNLMLMSQAMPLIYIESVNGEPFKKPNSFPEIRAAIKILGRNGMRAITAAVYKFNAEEQANAEVNLAEIKK